MIALCLLVGRVPAVAAAQADHDATIARVLELTNLERQKVGAPPLLASSELTSAAQGYSVVLASGECFEHTCGPVPDVADRLVELAPGPPAGLVPDIAGPRVYEMAALVRGYLRARGMRRLIVPVL